MFVRFVTLQIKPGMDAVFRRFYKTEVAPELLDNEGCMFAHLIENLSTKDEFMSLTFWRSRDEATEYEESGRYANLIDRNRPFLAESSEWRMQLNEDLTLSYEPVHLELEVERFEIAVASTDEAPDEDAVSDMYLRIVAVHTNPNKAKELRDWYHDIILPALLETDGCRYAYRAAGRNEEEMLSVTLWESQEHAAAYERSGKFDKLMDGIRPLLSSLTQWKMSMASDTQARTTTSDDVQVQGFRIAE
jgi:heme-degrading monooxygenase HmoA